jgi:predicted exporter
MVPRSPLDDPHTAAHAWARYRRLMRFMLMVTLLMVAGSFVALYRQNGLVSAHLYVAAALGVGFSMLLMSALMGLVFLSSGTGHDEAIADPLADEEERQSGG